MTVMQNIHRDQPLARRGELLENAQAAMVIVHGRGGTNHQALDLVNYIDVGGFAYLAPQAAGNSWYPLPFLAPIEHNEPGLSSALAVIGETLDQIQAAGIPPEKTMILGFSQGACLSLEFVARNARRYGGVAGLSGGLIGPDGTPHDYDGSLNGTPVFLGCSDVDFHIPLARVHHATEVLRGLGGDVTERIYPGLGHTINQDEIDFVRTMMQALVRTV